ncbi:MAG: thermonuclease family protein [Actinomycetota bacterium]
MKSTEWNASGERIWRVREPQCHSMEQHFLTFLCRCGRRPGRLMTAITAKGTRLLGGLALFLLLACGSGPSPSTGGPNHEAVEGQTRKNERRAERRPERKAKRRAQRKAERRAEARAESGAVQRARYFVLVSRVVDGDTIEVQLDDETTDVRLIGIDTPETVHPSEPVECYGPAASDFTSAALQGDAVRLGFDVERQDQYGRTLAYVWDEGELFNQVLVAKGFATVTTYPPNVRYVERFLAAQRDARQHDRGLWGSCSTAEGPDSDTASGGGGSAGEGCTDGYSPCLPPASDYDCAGGTADGPEYADGPIQVSGSDPYDLDSDDDGVACET